MNLNTRFAVTSAFVISFLNLPASWGYDSAKCKSELGHTNTALISSSTSFVTSTGPCAAIGMRDELERFIAENLDLIVADSARGSGEYLEALAIVSGCTNSASRNVYTEKAQSCESGIAQ